MTTANTLIRINTVISQTGLARSTVYKLIGEKDFPQPVKITSKSSAWVLSEVHAWMLSRMEDRKYIH